MLKLKVFIISVGIAFSIEIIHSIWTKGWRFTLEFFVGGFLWGFLKEYLYSFVRSYEFPHMPIKLLNVPIFIPIGWVFTFYLAYEFTNKLIKPKTEKDYKDFIIFAAFFSNFICIPIETAAMNMNWWELYGFFVNDNIASCILMLGWFSTSVVFFYLYFVAKNKLPREQLWFAVCMLIAWFVVEISFIVYLFTWAIIVTIIMMFFMLKYNKELICIFFVYLAIISGRLLTSSIPNATFVTIIFISIFIYIFVKLRLMDTKHQLSIKESL
jgi:hypothetical protein